MKKTNSPQSHPHPDPLPRKAKENKGKVLIALSGGIDSAVSAYLLIKQGYTVEAAFMKNWSSTKGLLKNDCPWLDDRREAIKVAAFLGIPLHTLDFEKQYQKNVMGYFFREYKAGRTPNPDVMCNKEIKFKLLYNWAIKNRFDFLATGHYAQVSMKGPVLSIKERKNTAKYKIHNTKYYLNRSADEFKDQTYFIYNIKTSQLPHILFPIGHLKKPQVKKLAKKIGLPNQNRKESMGLCFVGKIRLNEFLKQKIKPKTGEVKNKNGDIIGRHKGLSNFTIGQRQGIEVGAKGPYYVYAKDLKTNTLFVTNNPEDTALFTKSCQIHSVNWIFPNFESKIKNLKLQARYRHQGKLTPITVDKLKNDLYQIKFLAPQKSIASGQSLVIYEGKVCIGGGTIT